MAKEPTPQYPDEVEGDLDLSRIGNNPADLNDEDDRPSAPPPTPTPR